MTTSGVLKDPLVFIGGAFLNQTDVENVMGHSGDEKKRNVFKRAICHLVLSELSVITLELTQVKKVVHSLFHATEPPDKKEIIMVV